MERNAKALNAKSRTHVVRKISQSSYEVVSGGSGNVYEVTETAVGLQCNCRFGNPYGGKHKRHQSGCSHVVAVLAVQSTEVGRKLSTHASQEEAARQRRPKMEVGQGLWVTSRAA